MKYYFRTAKLPCQNGFRWLRASPWKSCIYIHLDRGWYRHFPDRHYARIFTKKYGAIQACFDEIVLLDCFDNDVENDLKNAWSLVHNAQKARGIITSNQSENSALSVLIIINGKKYNIRKWAGMRVKSESDSS